MRQIVIVYKNFLAPDDSVQIGGIETYILHLAETLTAGGYQVGIVQQSSIDCVTTLPYATVHKVCCKTKDPYQELTAYAERTFDEKDCLIFGAHTAIRRTAFDKTLAIQHGVHWDGASVPKVPKPLKRLYPLARFVEARSIISQISKVRDVVCVDYNFVCWLRTQGCVRMPQLTVIPNFIDTRIRFKRPDSNHKDTVRIVFARRFVERRGVRLLTATLPSILTSYPKVELTIAGEGPMEDYLRERFAGCKQVHFTKYAPQDSIAFHSQFDIALVPTIFSEGTSFSLLEAMYAGCCVLCTNVGGMTNIVLDGFNGRMVSPEESQFASALEELIQDNALRDRLSANAVASVSQGFSLESWSKRWLEVVDGVFDDAR